MSDQLVLARRLPPRLNDEGAHAPWEPARPLGTRWTRMSDSVRFLASVAGFATGARTSRLH